MCIPRSWSRSDAASTGEQLLRPACPPTNVVDTVPIPPGALRAAAVLGDRRSRPNLRWLSELVGCPEREAARALRDLGKVVAVEQQVRALHRSGGRAFYAQFRAPFELYALTRLLRPRHIVETGVSSGISSMHFLIGLKANRYGTLHSIDLPVQQRAERLGRDEPAIALPRGRSSGWAIPARLKRGWDLHIGPSQVLLPSLVAQLPRIDIFLHDSYHSPRHLAFELEAIREKLAPGAIVLADNTVWTGDAFSRFAAQVGAPVVRRGRSDLVGLRMPGARPNRRATGTSPRRARRSRTTP